MTDVVLFHHAQGLTAGVRHFADRLAAAGHQVSAPDLYEGRTFATLGAGLAYVEDVGFDTIVERGRLAAEELSAESVYAGFSLGVLPAQMLAQTQPGARGALLYHACVPTSEFGGAWPRDVPVQVHAMQDDPWFTSEGDIDAARRLVEEVDGAELFLYPGHEHLFADDSLPAYDGAAATLLLQRTTDFLDRLR